MINIKAQLRKKMIDKRNLMSDFDVKTKSENIENIILFSEEFKNSKSLFTYINVGSEVVTENIIKSAFEVGKKVAVPVAKKGEDMFFAEIKNLDELHKTKFGVLEPIADKTQQIVPDENTFFIVPGTAFDENLNRCGYGAGFYDKYFEKYKVNKKIAVTFDFQVTENIPTDEFDKKVDVIITEKRILGGELK